MEFIEKLKFASVCGIDCETQCQIYKAYNLNDILLRRRLALLLLGDEDRWTEIRCDGCKGEQALCWYRNCEVRNCAFRKDLEFCIQCSKYPCSSLLKQQQLNKKIITC